MEIASYRKNSLMIEKLIMNEKNTIKIPAIFVRPEYEEYKRAVKECVKAVQYLVSAERSIIEIWLAQKNVRLLTIVDNLVATSESCINIFIGEAESKVIELGIGQEVVTDAIMELKELKKQSQKIQAYYKGKAEEMSLESSGSRIDELKQMNEGRSV